MTTHTSSGPLVTESIECLERDVLAHLERLAPKDPPPGASGYRHNRPLDFDGRLGFNAGDHLKSILGDINCYFPSKTVSLCAARGNASISRNMTGLWPHRGNPGDGRTDGAGRISGVVVESPAVRVTTITSNRTGSVAR